MMRDWKRGKFDIPVPSTSEVIRTTHHTPLFPACTVLYCTVLYCTVLYCTVLYCTVLYCTVLHTTKSDV
jgi:hypothetical protein